MWRISELCRTSIKGDYQMASSSCAGDAQPVVLLSRLWQKADTIVQYSYMATISVERARVSGQGVSEMSALMGTSSVSIATVDFDTAAALSTLNFTVSVCALNV